MKLELKSVECVIDTDTMLVSRIMKDTIKFPNHGMEVHINNVPRQWYYNLDEDDFYTIDTLIKNQITNN